MRNISFAITTAQFKNRTKTVTRRNGWENLKVGEILMGVEKSQGLKRGEKIVHLGPIKVISVNREPLFAITKSDVIKEGFPDWSPLQFCHMYMEANKCEAGKIVTRIEFEYL